MAGTTEAAVSRSDRHTEKCCLSVTFVDRCIAKYYCTVQVYHMAKQELDTISLEGQDESLIPMLKKEEQRLRGEVDNAREEAEQIVSEAEKEAEKRVSEAEKQIPEEIEAERKREVAKMKEEAEKEKPTKKDIEKLRKQSRELKKEKKKKNEE